MRWNPSPLLNPRGRMEALASEDLIDLDEWADVRGRVRPFGVPAAATRALWERVERIPWSWIGRTTADERLLQVIQRARCALERALKERADDRAEAELVVDFAAHLPDPRGRNWQTVRLHHGPLGSPGEAITLGLPDELGWTYEQ